MDNNHYILVCNI